MTRSPIAGALVLLVSGTLAAACGSIPPQQSNESSTSALELPGWFAFTVADGDLWAIPGDGSDHHQLTTSEDGVDISPTWAPDASQLAYRHSTGAGGGLQGTDMIRIVQADGSGAHDLVPGSFPAWSPDGAWIAFRGVTGVDLALIRPDGSHLTELAAPNAECPVWSPDASKVLYCRNVDTAGNVSDNWGFLIDASCARQEIRQLSGAFDPIGWIDAP